MVWKAFNKQPLNYPTKSIWAMWDNEAAQLWQKIEWWEFLDICQTAWALLESTVGRGFAHIFANQTNALFSREFLSWGLSHEGLIERIHPPAITQKLQEAHLLLSDPRFAGPEEQFVKANQHLNKRPQPDTENCVKDAVGALEGVARIVSGQDKAILPQIVKSHFNGKVHTTLQIALEKVYAYRGDVGGVGHGQTKPSDLGIEEARLVLGLCADYIVYLVGKFSPSSN
jgi:hypothetical protein